MTDENKDKVKCKCIQCGKYTTGIRRENGMLIYQCKNCNAKVTESFKTELKVKKRLVRLLYFNCS